MRQPDSPTIISNSSSSQEDYGATRAKYATLREDIHSKKRNVEGMKDKIYQLTRAITNMMARDNGANKNAFAYVPPPVDSNPLYGFISNIQGTKADITQLKTNVPLPEGSVPILVQNGAFRPTQVPVPHDNYLDLSQKYEDEGPRYMDQKNKLATHPVTTIGEPRVDKKYKILEERLRVVEGFNIFGVDAIEMCLVPDVVIPLKFKTPYFENYRCVNCPRNYLRMFVRKMVAYAANEKLVMHYFQDNLSAASLDWYIQLERTHVKTLEDLANAFLRQYKYNLDTAPNRMQLQNLSHKETELVDMFMGTLQVPYYKKMIGSVLTGFTDLVIIGERIENGLKSGKIRKPSSSRHNSRRYSNNNNSKKRGTNVVTIDGYSQIPYYPYVVVVNPGQYPQQVYPIPQVQQPGMLPPQNQQQWNGYPRRDQHGPRNEFDPIPMTHTQILPYLIQRGLVEPKPLVPPSTSPPCGYDVNAICDFHAGSLRHTTENFLALKFKVQDLLNCKIISFDAENPNIKNNLMLWHNGPTVNAIKGSKDSILIKEVDQVKTYMARIREKLIGYEMFGKLHADCKVFPLKSGKCEKMKRCMQLMMDQGVVQIGYSKKVEDISAIFLGELTH
ncbi:uncharacterized protein LOC127123358 [Lathyrus oleraceus]|uniref:uncharacterized protein LOC127123358 n=1 Tax=Pisum sativum TaxID=3888 RepID=UPI0021CF80DD|nr:uncharacterized protein LOC127123358 [Pisum sativum]